MASTPFTRANQYFFSSLAVLESKELDPLRDGSGFEVVLELQSDLAHSIRTTDPHSTDKLSLTYYVNSGSSSTDFRL